MHGDLLLILLIGVAGLVAFIVGTIYSVGWLMAGIGRGFLRMFGGETKVLPNARRSPLVCPRTDCRKAELRPARFCSQCGTQLQ